MRFTYLLLIGRILGPEVLALSNALVALAVFTSLFWSAPAGYALARFLPLPEFANRAIWILNRSFWMANGFVALTVGIVLYLFGLPPGSIVGCVALSLAYGAYLYSKGRLLGQDRIVFATILDTIASFLSLSLLSLVLVMQAHALILIPLALSYGFFAAFSWPRNGVKPSRGSDLGVLQFTVNTAIAGLALGVLVPSVSLLVPIFEPASVAGLVAAGLTLATPVNQLAQALTQVLVPRFASGHQTHPAQTQRIQIRVLGMSTILFLFLFGALFLGAPLLIEMVFGTSFVDAATYMRLISVSLFFMSIMASPLAYLLATGREKLNAKIWAWFSAAALVTMLCSAPFLGVWGILAGFSLGCVGGAIAVIISSLRRVM